MRLVRLHWSLSALIVASMACACRSVDKAAVASQVLRGTETSGGGLPMSPIVPKEPFSFACDVSVVHDATGATQAAAATFTLTNKGLAVQSTNLPWQFGHVDSLSPLAPLQAGGGDATILEKDVRLSSVVLSFDYTTGAQRETVPFQVQLTLIYDITRDGKHQNHFVSTHQAFTPGVTLNVDARTYANGVGENQEPFLFAARCERQP